MRIRTKIVGLGVLVAALTGIVTGVVLFAKQRTVQARIAAIDGEVAHLHEQMSAGQMELLENNAAQVVQAIWRSVEASEKRTAARLAHSLAVARQMLADAGGVRFGDRTVAWQAVDQTTRAVQEVLLPEIVLGGAPLVRNADPAVAAAVVDPVKNFTRDWCTVFQRMNDAGDMLRVSTSVVTAAGQRAVGTFVPHRLPDGSDNPVIKAVLAGQTYVGRAQVVDQWCATAYEPIWDEARQRVVGMLFVGVPMGEITRELRAAIQQTTVGRTGYVFVLQGSGPTRGTYVVSAGGKRDGENIWDARDSAGRPFIQSMIKVAIEARGEAVKFERYPWQNAGETAARDKFAAVLHHPTSDWVIGASCYLDDYDGARALLTTTTDKMRAVADAAAAEFRRAAVGVGITAVVMVVLSIAIGWWVARNIGRKLDVGVQFAQALARGDLTGHMKSAHRDEIDVLAGAMNEMSDRLRDAFSRVARTVDSLNQSSDKLGTVSANVSSVAQKTANQAQVVATSADQINRSVASVAGASEEMSATIREMAERSAHAAKVAAEAADVAHQTNDTVLKLGTSSTEIGSVVAVINSIAEQTNLLALNATIEAARAGDAGRGFAVVANEVKELARQTAVATDEIQRKIAAIQGDSRASADAIRRISGIIEQINSIQTSIAAATEEQAVTMNEISRNSAEASQGTGEIAQSITAVSETARSTTGSATSTSAAARELARLGTELRELVSSFKFEESVHAAVEAGRLDAAATQRTIGIVWDQAKMGTGVAKIDEQHRELIRRINTLEEAIVRCAGAEEIEPLLKFLEDYTHDHFSFEEGLMEKHACPAKGANLAAHQKFLENFNRLVADFRANGPTLQVLDALKESIGRWLVNHICSIDKKLGGCRSAIAALPHAKVKTTAPVTASAAAPVEASSSS